MGEKKVMGYDKPQLTDLNGDYEESYNWEIRGQSTRKMTKHMN